VETLKSEQDRYGHTSVEAGKRANELWPENGKMHEQMEHTTHIKDASGQRSESESENTCESERRKEQEARRSSDTHPSATMYTPKEENVQGAQNPTTSNKPRDLDWNNDTDRIEDYVSPPLIKWTDAEVERTFTEEPFRSLDLSESDVGPSAIMQLKRLIIQYTCLFEPQSKPTVRGYKVNVDVIEGARPAVGKMYRQSHQNEKLLKQWIDQAVKKGLIEPSTSPWRAGVLCIPKNNGQSGLEGIQVVHSFVLLNKVLEPVSWPLPRIDDLLNDIAVQTI
jgi:hypothetical protein